MPGVTTSAQIEPSLNVSRHGVWLLLNEQEYFLAYEHFPWFEGQPLSVLRNVQQVRPGHFYWPQLDVDLTQEMIEHPERYPLTAK